MNKRITYDKNILGGSACIRGMKISVAQIISFIFSNPKEILNDFPDLEEEDIDAVRSLCLNFVKNLSNFERLRGTATIKMSTDEIMSMTRGKDTYEQCTCALVEAIGMLSNNLQRVYLQESMAYELDSFLILLKKYNLGDK